MTMQIIKSYLHWATLAPEGAVKVFQVKKQHSEFLLKKKQGKLDQHQILVFHGDVDHFSIWLWIELFVILGHFLHFYPINNPKNQN